MFKAIKKWSFFILIPVIGGLIIGLLTNSNNDYSNLITPSFAPPGFIFPIVWIILYILMGISSCLVYNNHSLTSEKALKKYYFQLFVNYAWSIIFFSLKLRLFAFIWILLLIYLVFDMIISFYKENKTAAYLQIPYMLWLLFAAALNLGVVLLN